MVACTGPHVWTCCTEHSDKQHITDVPTVAGARDRMVKWLQIVMVGDVLSYDGDDMLWMQL